MLSMSIPWWEFIVRALVVYIFLLISLRLSGKRQIGQLSPFDLVLLLVLSNAVQNSMNGGDNSLIGGLISATALIILNQVVGLLSYKSKSFENFAEGSPQIIVHNGRVSKNVMFKEKLTIHDLESAMRQAGLTTIEEIHFAVLEVNGAISIIQKK